jgi:hypothetical protein
VNRKKRTDEHPTSNSPEASKHLSAFGSNGEWEERHRGIGDIEQKVLEI